jgi:hypothetical protein
MFFQDEDYIKKWLSEYCSFGSSDYQIVKINNLIVVNVFGSVFINKKNLYMLPIKFNTVVGNFNCANNELTSLRGCPEIVHGYFDCTGNKLKTLEFCPKIIDEDFFSSRNMLKSLNFLPEKSGMTHLAKNQELTNLYKNKFCFLTLDEVKNMKIFQEKLNEYNNLNNLLSENIECLKVKKLKI